LTVASCCGFGRIRPSIGSACTCGPGYRKRGRRPYVRSDLQLCLVPGCDVAAALTPPCPAAPPPLPWAALVRPARPCLPAYSSLCASGIGDRADGWHAHRGRRVGDKSTRLGDGPRRITIQLLTQLHSRYAPVRCAPDTTELLYVRATAPPDMAASAPEPLVVRPPCTIPSAVAAASAVHTSVFGVRLLLWLLVGTAVLLAAIHWHDLTADVGSLLVPHNVLLLWLIFPVLKTCTSSAMPVPPGPMVGKCTTWV
jgi:hypothetical protein